METILITGGSGFLGQAIVQSLRRRGKRVIIYDESYPSSEIEHRGGSILDMHQIQAALSDVDTVFHLAGMLGTTELMNQGATAVDVNVKGSVNVLEASRLSGVERVFYPTKPNEWLNTYSITKRAGEEFARMYNQAYDLDVRILRWLNAYGPGQKAWPIRKAVPLMVLQALNDLPIEIFGDGSQPVDLIFVDDLAEVTVGYVELSEVTAETRDTGLSVRLTVNEMAKTIRSLAESKSKIQKLPMRFGEDDKKRVQLLDIPTAASLVGSIHATPLNEGLQRTIEYYRHLPERILKKVLAFHYGRIPGRGDDVLTSSCRAPY